MQGDRSSRLCREGHTGSQWERLSRDAISQAAVPSSRLKPLPRTPFIVRGGWSDAMAVSRWTAYLCGPGPAEASTSSLDGLAAAAMIEASEAVGRHSGRYETTIWIGWRLLVSH
jgi:hypothetical protein